MSKKKETTKNKDKNKAFLDNQWKKGQSGNPKGRPRGRKDYLTVYKEAMQKKAIEEGKTVEEMEHDLILLGFEMAKAGNYNYYSSFLDRVFGRPTQPVEVEDVMVDDETKNKIDELLKGL